MDADIRWKQRFDTYNVEIAEGIAEDILDRFYPAFTAMAKTFSDIADKDQSDQ